jgi:flagellar basal-body rod modification protein FlgD
MSVGATSSTTNTNNSVASGETASSTRNTGSSTLDVNDFLSLITVQLTNQDPLKPMEDTQFISQMASFTSLQQMQTLSKDFSSFTTDSKSMNAQNYLGKNVTLATDKGVVSGMVTAVTYNDGNPEITVGGKSYDPAFVTGITMAPAPTTTPTTTP